MTLDIARRSAPINSDDLAALASVIPPWLFEWLFESKKAKRYRRSQALQGYDPATPGSLGAAAVDGPFAASAEALFGLGYGPIPEKGLMRIPPKGWTTFYPDTPRTSKDIQKLIKQHFDALGIAIACGHKDLVGVDIDTDDGKLIEMIDGVLPHYRVAKRGSKGRTPFFRFVGDIDEMCNRGFYLKKPDGSKGEAPFLEILWIGRKTTIPPTMHKKTNKPYVWLDPEHTLFNTRVEDLPVITMADIEALEAALQSRLWEPPPPDEETGKVLDHPPTDLEEKRFRGVSRAMLDRLANEVCRAPAPR